MMQNVTIHTGGSCLGNPGSGGWAAVLCCPESEAPLRRELGGGFRRTTNNRMEILA
ncbi:MAG: ribonuclease HI, partial [Mailhella sp.]|nr:ribonuclease HI [Mailhella sp.]